MNDELDGKDGDKAFRGLLQITCEAVRELELAGLLDSIPKTEDFKIIIAEHDEPNILGLERYELFVRTGAVRCHGDPDIRPPA